MIDRFKNTKSLFIISGFFLILSFAAFLLYSFAETGSNRYPNADADTAIEAGKSLLFSKTIDGGLNAYQSFQNAYSSYYNTATNEQKIKIRAYLAVSRMFDIFFRNDGGTVDTLTELLAQFGITRTGNDFEDLEFDIPLNNDDMLILPATAPSGEAVRGFLAGSFITALNASIADMDAVISLLGASESKEIISKSIIAPGDPTQRDVEVDDGDYYLFRSFLKMTKSYVLLLTAYNMDISLKEIVALGNMNALNPRALKEMLDRYTNFLKVMTSTGSPAYNGAAKLAEAKATLISAIDDYVSASEKIRNDADTTAGADEVTAIDETALRDELFMRDQLVELQNSLTANRAAKLGSIDAEWDFVSQGGRNLRFSFADGYFIDGSYESNDGYCDFISCGGHIDYSVISGDNITMYVSYGGQFSGKAKLTGTLNAQKTAISGGQYYYWNYPSGPWVYQGTFTASRISFEDNRLNVNFNPLFGDGTTALSLRDILPQFNEYGHPERGTMGHGLVPANDPTLGGLMPDMTSQEEWTKGIDILQPSGSVTVPTATIIVQDGSVADWNGINPVFTDVTGETDDTDKDIASLYLAKDAANLYIRIDTAGAIPASDNVYGVKLKKLPGDEYEIPGDVKIYAQYDFGTSRWEAYIGIVNSSGSFQQPPISLGSTSVKVFGNHVEMQAPLSTVGEIGGRFIEVTSQSWWGSRYDDNATCLQILPTANLTGTLTVPLPPFDGQGLIYIGVYQFNSGLNRDAKYLLGNKIVYSGEYTAGMAYAINKLPLGEDVFVAVHWDRDLNGLVTPGDYTNLYSPLLLVQNSVLNINASDDHPAYPPPEFKFVSISSMQYPSSPQNVQIGAFLKSPGAGDVTVTLTGAGGRYELAPVSFVNYKLGMNYGATISYLPDGDYTFEAVDSLGRKVEKTYHYQYNGTLPFVSNLTPAANAYVASTTPTLSWTPPSGDYYYQVQVFDMEGKVGMFMTPYLTSAQTSITLPAGLLRSNTPYGWVVRLYDSNTQCMNGTQVGARFYTGEKQALAIDSAQLFTVPPSLLFPQYKNYCYAYIPGTAWWDITSFKVYRGATVYYNGKPWSPWNASSSYYMDGRLYMSDRYRVQFNTDNPLSDGVDYKLEVKTAAETVTYTITYVYSSAPSAVSMSSLNPGNNYYFKTLTPQFSWTAIPEQNAWYHIRILDGTNTPVNPGKRTTVWQSAWSNNTEVQVPSGILKPGASYYWQIGSTISSADPNVQTININNWTNNESNKRWLFTIHPPLYGDINSDYKIDLADAITAMQAEAGLHPVGVSNYYVSPFHPVIKSDIDVNADNRIGAEEVIYILQKATELR